MIVVDKFERERKAVVPYFRVMVQRVEGGKRVSKFFRLQLTPDEYGVTPEQVVDRLKQAILI